jgi:hypothetical protein
MSILKRLSKYMPSPYPSLSRNLNRDDIVGENNGIIVREEDNAHTSSHAAFNEGEHWTTAAATGAGKTVFNLALMEEYRRKYPHARRYILNSSWDEQMERVVGGEVFEGNKLPPKLPSSKCVIWQPDSDDLALYNRWLLKVLYDREPAIILLDEVASLSGYSRAVTILEGHMKLLKQGRKHKITVLNSTQEMTRVPLVMFRQMTHFVQMRLGNDSTDLSVARRYLGISKEEQREPNKQYGGFYKHVGIGFPMEEFDDYSHFFRSIGKN